MGLSRIIDFVLGLEKILGIYSSRLISIPHRFLKFARWFQYIMYQTQIELDWVDD